MSTLDTRGSGEFPDVVVAGSFAVDTGLDAITFSLDLGKRKVDFRGNASYIETSDI
jgi:hypothetical protein